MPIRDPPSSAVETGHRTNSLGSAKVDCHTCLQLRIQCDRQRPRCGTCIKNRRECGGFTMNLVWKAPKRSTDSRQSHTNKYERVDIGDSESGPREARQRQFKFVKGRRRIKRESRPQREGKGRSTVDNDRDFSIPMDDRFSILSAKERTSNTMSVFKGSLPSETSRSEKISRDTESSAFFSYDIPPRTPWSDSQFLESDPNLMQTDMESIPSSQLDCSDIFEGDFDTLENAIDVQRVDMIDRAPVELDANMLTRAEPTLARHFSVSPGIQFRDLAHKFDPILALYNREFCVLPLTADCLTNPFRISENGCQGSEFLLHAILALSSHHLSKKDNCPVLKVKMHDHQSMAIRLFSNALFRSSSTKLLDTLLILVNFQATQSAFGTWNVHLLGAQKILEGMGVKEMCDWSPRIRAQLAILVWMDVTVALISRREPLLPEAYLQTLMGYDRNRRDGWTFFILNGCPVEFAMAMRRLARLASIYEKASNLEWTTFDTTPIEGITKQITQWKNEEDITADEAAYVEDDLDGRRNRFHCIEAWRYAILLYARRVFMRKQDTPGLRSIGYFSREILDHVRSIPRTATVQKQVLLPVFLAGAEAGVESVRAFVRDYCTYWSAKSGHLMFNTVGTLLENIWSESDLWSRDVYWWGLKVTNTAFSSMPGEQLPVSELLLG